MADKIRVAIVGWGNVGRGVRTAILKNPDISLSYVLSRRPLSVTKELVKEDDSVCVIDATNENEINSIKNQIDVGILCGGSKEDLPKQGPYFAQFFNTVDSFDTHSNIPEYFSRMDQIAKNNNHVSVISTGWDPGTFSLERVLADSFIPGAERYTFWGPGVSQGHSDAVRQIKGVQDARQYTLPVKEALEKVRAGENPTLTTRDKHTRLVYVVAKSDADQERIKNEIVNMSGYFADYNTNVNFISAEEMQKNHSQYPHGGFVMTTGTTREGNKARIEYSCQWDSNPEATGSILVAYARAVQRLSKEGKTGAFTILDIPAAYLSARSGEELRKTFM